MKLTLSSDSRQLDVEIRCVDWDWAGIIASRNELEPPNGYKLISSLTKCRRRTGRRANLCLRFVWRPQHKGQVPPPRKNLLETFAADAKAGGLGGYSEESWEAGSTPDPD